MRCNSTSTSTSPSNFQIHFPLQVQSTMARRDPRHRCRQTISTPHTYCAYRAAQRPALHEHRHHHHKQQQRQRQQHEDEDDDETATHAQAAPYRRSYRTSVHGLSGCGAVRERQVPRGTASGTVRLRYAYFDYDCMNVCTCICTVTCTCTRYPSLPCLYHCPLL